MRPWNAFYASRDDGLFYLVSILEVGRFCLLGMDVIIREGITWGAVFVLIYLLHAPQQCDHGICVTRV